jgi:predicted acetyltransferase
MDFRPITADEVKDVARLMRLAFGDSGPLTEHYAELLGIDEYRAIVDDGRMLACIAYFDDAHRFGSGSVPAWGITSVGVDPAVRGRGISGMLIENTLKLAASKGPAILTLYASAPAVYRKMGFERAGKTLEYKGKTAPMAASGAAIGSFRAVDPEDPETTEILAGIRSAWLPMTSGPFERGETIWKCLMRPYDKKTDVFIWRNDDGEPGGYAILHQTTRKLEVADLCVPTGEAASAMLGFLGGFRAIHSDITWNGGLVDPLIMAMNDRWWFTVRHEHWFSRIVDVETALASRGYPKGIAGSLSLTIDDPIIDQNVGTFAMEVADRRASVTRDNGDVGSLHLTVQSLVPLFTGLLSASRLAAMGRLNGPRDAIETADLLFRGPTPWMEESF